MEKNQLKNQVYETAVLSQEIDFLVDDLYCAVEGCKIEISPLMARKYRKQIYDCLKAIQADIDQKIAEI